MAETAFSEPADSVEVIWQPQPGPQTALVTCPVFEVFYGGARGGGKTDGVLGDFIGHADQYGEHAVGLMIRRERTQLIETIERSRQIYAPLGAKYHEQDKMWRFPNGARLRFAYLERDADAEAYQGHSYTRVYIEELGNFPTPGPVLKLMATLRSPTGVPVGFRATGNPGGPGHSWVKTRYIDPSPVGWERLVDERTGLERIYIPSRVSDNHYLGADYIQRLRASGSDELVRAWLEGDWSAIEGAFFDCWSTEKHVVAPFTVPGHWLRFRSMDWGSAAPFSVGWWAVASEPFRLRTDGCVGVGEIRNSGQYSEAATGMADDDGRQGHNPSLDIGRGSVARGVSLPRGALVRYREWYGTGQKLTAEDVALGILEKEVSDVDEAGKSLIQYGVLDPSAFAQDGGPSIAERMHRVGVTFRRADNKRVPQRGAMGGWDLMRHRMVGDLDGNPMLVVFSTCKDFIRTVPVLQHDPDRPEDLDTEAEDHVADETRYACASRPWARPTPRPDKPIVDLSIPTLRDVLKADARNRGRAGDRI
jgi:hypothetical protein